MSVKGNFVTGNYLVVFHIQFDMGNLVCLENSSISRRNKYSRDLSKFIKMKMNSGKIITMYS